MWECSEVQKSPNEEEGADLQCGLNSSLGHLGPLGLSWWVYAKKNIVLTLKTLFVHLVEKQNRSAN